MKKFIYSLCCLLALGINLNSSIIATSSTTMPVSYFDQGRIGFGLAVEYLNAEAKLKDNYSPFSFNYQSDRAQTRKQVNVAPSIELGTIILNDYYLGLISSWRYVGAKTRSRAPLKNMTHFYHEFKINYYVDILAKPGSRIMPNTMLYGLVGPSIVRWSHTTDQVNRVLVNNQETREDR
ncbi:MAG: hypothetical protein IBJ00_06730, partial [Alphaproteobacteria bacterium]|nr:hypothetical protein [Alphaproteobacteria bacterium]